MKGWGRQNLTFSRTDNLSVNPTIHYAATHSDAHTQIHWHTNAMETVGRCRSHALWSLLSFAGEQKAVKLSVITAPLSAFPACLKAPLNSIAQSFISLFLFFLFECHSSIVVLTVLLLLTITEHDPAWVITKVNIMALCEEESSMRCFAKGVAPAKIIAEITQRCASCEWTCRFPCVINSKTKIKEILFFLRWMTAVFQTWEAGRSSKVSMVTETSVNMLLTPSPQCQGVVW